MMDASSMGHAFHFLQRIERLSALQADVALALYRKPSLVLYILNRVPLPDGAERVALALEHEKSPHVIVTRTGAFVTCLAAGMTLGATPVITRAQLDQVSEKYEVIRAALRQAEQEQETQQLITRLWSSGSTLTREELATLRTITPLIGDRLITMSSDMVLKLEQHRNMYRRQRMRSNRPQVADWLRLYWEQMWAIGHVCALCGGHIEDALETLDQAESDKVIWYMRPILHLASSTMAPAVLLRATWAAGRIGVPYVSQYASRVEKATSLPDLVHATSVLVAVGLRHEQVRAEASEALAQGLHRVRALTDEDLHPAERSNWEWILAHGHQMLGLQRDADYLALHRSQGAERILARSAGLPAGHAQRWDAAADVPDALALSALANVDASTLASSVDRSDIIRALPWVARAAAVDLYVPAQFMDVYGARFEVDTVRDLIDRHIRYFALDTPTRAEARPGRNEPCPCGSGKKYKRCCGVAT
jgi:hypothetical protein